MTQPVKIQPLTAAAFAPFGDIIARTATPSFTINDGQCDRYHDLARLEFTGGGRANISLARSRPAELPLRLTMVERHPLGSQAFIPVDGNPFLIVVAPDKNGTPGMPLAFMSNGAQGINYLRNTWHGILTPIGAEQTFVIIDRAGEGDNLQEHHFDAAFLVG